MAKCLNPFQKDTGEYFPCGNCITCLKARVSQWAYRIRKQFEISDTGHFVTLTYNTDNVPITNHGFMTLVKKDAQKFIKRLRHYENNENIKYYLCGEYGTKNKRPHYHAIILNVLDVGNISRAWQIDGKEIGKWQIDPVNDATINYTLKYMEKDRAYKKSFEADDRQKEFAIMSKGMGSNYLTPARIKWHKDDISRQFIVDKGGIKIRLPRYYKDKIFNNEEREEIVAILAPEMNLHNEEYVNEMLKEYGPNWRIKVREQIMHNFTKLKNNSKNRQI